MFFFRLLSKLDRVSISSYKIRAVHHMKNFEILNKLVIILLFVPILFFIPPLLEPGTVIENGDYPYLDTGNYAIENLWLWNEKGSHPTFEIVARFPIISLWYVLSHVNVTSEFASKIMIPAGFALASFSFYFSFVSFFASRGYNLSLLLRLTALLGALFYAYNVWSFHQIGPWYLWIGYAILPLFIISTIQSFKGGLKNWHYILLVILTWTIASTMPQMLVFYMLIFGGIFSFFLLRHLKHRQEKKPIYFIKPFLAILSLYLLVNTYWIYPILLSSTRTEIAPSYVVSEDIVQLLSRDSSFSNVFRLIEDWWRPRVFEVHPPWGSIEFYIWLLASYSLPIFAFSAILWRRNRYTVLFSVLAATGIFLTMGTNAPIDVATSALYMPLITDIAWIFRNPDKWAFIIALAYSVLIGIAAYEVLKIIQRKKYKKLGSILVIITLISLIGLYSYPSYSESMQKRFNPVLLPEDDFTLLNNDLSSSVATEKIFIMPDSYGRKTDWSENHTLAHFYPMSSIKPSMGASSALNTKTYYNYFTDSLIVNNTRAVDDFLYPLGTSYIVYHFDMQENSRAVDLLKSLTVADGINLNQIAGFFLIFKADQNVSAVNIPLQNIGIIGGGLDKLSSLTSLPDFNSSESSVFFVDQESWRGKYDLTKKMDSLILPMQLEDLILTFVDDKYVLKPYDASYRHDPNEAWSKAATADPLHGTFVQYLKRIGGYNRDFDYGKGLVFTSAQGDRLDIPLSIQDSGNYDLYMRYFETIGAGTIGIYLDGSPVREITARGTSDSFVSTNVANINLTKGEHVLSLENVEGTNAINIFAVVPRNEVNRLTNDFYSLVNNVSMNTYLLEAESSFDYGIGDLLQGTLDVSRKYGTNASNGEVLTLNAPTEVSTNLDIVKSSTYNVAIRARTCESCTLLTVQIGEHSYEVPANSSDRQLQWMNFTTFIEQGEKRLTVSSNGATDLDLVAIYSNEDSLSAPIKDLFSTSVKSPVQILEYEKINPTKHLLKINTTRPFVLSLAENYHPLWYAHTDNYRVDSFPLYSITNGFYITKTGEYSLTIEYEPQSWFYSGAIISIVSTIGILAGLVFIKMNLGRKLKGFKLLTDLLQDNLKTKIREISEPRRRKPSYHD